MNDRNSSLESSFPLEFSCEDCNQTSRQVPPLTLPVKVRESFRGDDKYNDFHHMTVPIKPRLPIMLSIMDIR